MNRRSRGFESRIAYALLAMASVVSCDDAVNCTTELRSPIVVNVVDASDSAVAADAVRLKNALGGESDCRFWEGQFRCHEGPSGRAELTVHVGDHVYTRSLTLVDEPDGCHTAPQEITVVLDDLPVCQPQVAVRGTMRGPDGEPVRDAQVTLLHDSEEDDEAGGWSTACSVADDTYSCPALNPYVDQSYSVILSFGVSQITHELTVLATDCQVETQELDFDLRAADAR